MTRGTPPFLAGFLARRYPAEVAEALLGDLEERRHEALASHRHRLIVAMAYWREVTAAIWCAPRTVSAPPQPLHDSGDGLVSSLIQDVHQALRLMRRRPGFSLLAILTLGLGIGASTAIFSAVNPILFESLPYPNADRVVTIVERTPIDGESHLGFATYSDLATQTHSFAATAALSYWTPTATGTGEPEVLNGQSVSTGYFRVLGISPALGRNFDSTEDVVGAPPVAILSHGLWMRRYGGDPAIVGKAITINGLAYTVVGVMPAGFENVLAPKAEIWRPLRYGPSLGYACRSCRHLRVVARVAPGVTLAQAAADLGTVFRRLVHDYPNDYGEAGILARPLHEQVVKGIRPALLAVLGAVGLVLLIACVNVMNLLLARGARRRTEFALRGALGASRPRVMRQLLTESVVLALVGGLVGLAIAAIGVRTLVAISPADLPRLDAIHLDRAVLLFALVTTFAVALAFGMLPAWHAARADLQQDLKQGTNRVAGGGRSRTTLVVVGVALAVILLSGAGLLLHSMRQLLRVSPGFAPEGVLTMQVSPSGAAFGDNSTTWNFYDRALSAVKALPGVQAAAWTSQLPVSGDFDGYGVISASHPPAQDADAPSGFRYAVSADYLQVMGIKLERGRAFDDQDVGGHPPVMLLSRGMAERLFPGADPLGERLRLGGPDAPWRTVVGVVDDVAQTSLDGGTSDGFYLPETQWLGADVPLSLVIKASGELSSLVAPVRQAIWHVNKDVPITRVATMPALLDSTTTGRRFVLVLFELFGVIALVLASAGIYGLLAEMVSERRHELGIRASLGASSGALLGLVLRRGLRLTLLGLVAGLLCSFVLSRGIKGLLFGVERLDPVTYLLVPVLLLVTGLVACWAPASRAARVDPAVTLRSE